MTIDKNTVVSLTYQLKVNDELLDQADASKPLVFLWGVGQTIPGFESQLEGKKVGDTYDIQVSSDQGYGDINPQMIIELPMSTFMIDGKLIDDLQVGAVIPLQDQQGNALQGKVLEIGEQTAKLDFNHPLAGKDLHFTGEILDLREATSDEIDHGHVHGPGGAQH